MIFTAGVHEVCGDGFEKQEDRTEMQVSRLNACALDGEDDNEECRSMKGRSRLSSDVRRGLGSLDVDGRVMHTDVYMTKLMRA